MNTLITLESSLRSTNPRSAQQRFTNRASLLAFVVAALICFGGRYFYLFHYADFDRTVESLGGDAYAYLQIAFTLSKTGQFGEFSDVNAKEVFIQGSGAAAIVSTSVWRTAYRPPLWPSILALLLKASNYNLRHVFLLRWLLDLLTLFLFSRFLLTLDLHWSSRLAALFLFSVHPAWVCYSTTLLSEPMTLLVHISLALSISGLANSGPSLARLACTGVLSGLVVLEHSYYVLFPLLLVGALYLSRRINVRDLLVVALAMAVTVAPWVLRNMALYHTRSPILTTSAGINIAKGWNAWVLGYYRNTVEWTPQNGVDAKDLVGVNEAERSAIYTRTALRFARQNWRLIPALLTRKLAGAVTPFPEIAKPGILETGRAVFQVVSFLPVLIVLFSNIQRSFRGIAAPLVISYLVMSILSLPAIRYRFPLIWIEVLSVVVVVEFWLRRNLSWGRGDGRSGERALN